MGFGGRHLPFGQGGTEQGQTNYYVSSVVASRVEILCWAEHPVDTHHGLLPVPVFGVVKRGTQRMHLGNFWFLRSIPTLCNQEGDLRCCPTGYLQDGCRSPPLRLLYLLVHHHSDAGAPVDAVDDDCPCYKVVEWYYSSKGS